MSWGKNIRRGVPPVTGKYGTGKTAGGTQVTYSGNTGHTYAGYQRPQLSVPTDTIDKTKVSFVLFKQSWLDAMSAVCKPAAGEAEFQIHYRALQVRIKTELNEVIFSVPLYFYNFPQRVTSGSVSYHLNDMEAEAKKGDTIIDNYVQVALQEYPIIAAATHIYPDATVTYSEVDAGSLHRHPGRFGFSSIDYDKNPTNPGVIYREAEAIDKVHTDSVIYLGKNTEIYTTETRILNLEKEGQGVKGTYCQIPTITYVYKDNEENNLTINATLDQFAELLKGYATDEHRDVKDNAKDYLVVASMNASTRTYALVNEILDDFAKSTLVPSMENVVASRISSAYATRTTYTRSTWQDDDEDTVYGYSYGYGYGVSYGGSGKKKPKTTNQVQTRKYGWDYESD